MPAGRPPGSTNRLGREAFKALEDAAGPRLAELYREMFDLALDRSVHPKTRIPLLIHLDMRLLGRPAQFVHVDVPEIDNKNELLALLDEWNASEGREAEPDITDAATPWLLLPEGQNND